MNIRWITVVLLAFLLVPMDASTAVIHVPIFCPKSTNTALGSVISPLVASACRIPTDAEEDWMMAVNTAPARIPRTGLENLVIRDTKASESLRGIIAELIISIPMKSTPRPATI